MRGKDQESNRATATAPCIQKWSYLVVSFYLHMCNYLQWTEFIEILLNNRHHCTKKQAVLIWQLIKRKRQRMVHHIVCLRLRRQSVCAGGRHHRAAAQRAKFAWKVHKPPLWVNVINFEINGLDASMWVPWSPLDPKKSWCTDRSIQIHKKQAEIFSPM